MEYHLLQDCGNIAIDIWLTNGQNWKKNSDSYSLPTTTKQIFVWQQHVFVVLFIDNNTDCFALQACRQYHSFLMTKVTTN